MRGECYLQCDPIKALKTDLVKDLVKIREVSGSSCHPDVILSGSQSMQRTRRSTREKRELKEGAKKGLILYD